MAKPVAKVTFKDLDGNRADCAIVWPATRKSGEVMEGLYNFQAITEVKDGQFPTIPLVQALERAAKKEGYINFDLGFDEDGNKLALTPKQTEEGF